MRRTIRSFGILVLLGLAVVPACGGSNDSPDDLLSQALQAMQGNPRFRIFREEFASGGEVSFDRPADKPRIEFILPDRFSYYEEDAYDNWAYDIAVGSDQFVSEDGVNWQEIWGTGGAFSYARQNPYKYVKHALNPVDAGNEMIGGEAVRVLEAELDVVGWAKDNLPPSQLVVSVDCQASESEPDRALVKSLGYEFLFQPNGPILSKDTYIKIDPARGSFWAEVKNATELTPELKRKLSRIVEAFGIRSCDFDNAEVKAFGGEEYISQITSGITSMGLRIHIEKGSGLPRLIEIEPRRESSLGAEKRMVAIGIVYDEGIRIEKPPKVLHERKAEALFGMIQDTSGQLQQLLRSFKEEHGVFPERLDPESMRDTLKALSSSWPDNAVTGEPMVQKKNRPGDYYYQPLENGSLYELILYNYDGVSIDYSLRGGELAPREAPLPPPPPTGKPGQEIPDALSRLTPSRIPPPLTESEKAQTLEIAIRDSQVLSMLKDTEIFVDFAQRRVVEIRPMSY